MAHNIFFNETTGQHSFFSVKQKAWHGLGQIVSEHPTSAEAIKFAGLDYEVIKSPLFTTAKGGMTVGNDGMVNDNVDIPVHGHYATMRTDNNTVFGIVGKDYQIVQNREAFGFFDAIVGGGNGIIYETAGALGMGERIFITAKLPDYIRVGNGDDVSEKYLFLTTSHDGSGSITAAFTPIRIVCQNTLNAALGGMINTIRIRHTANAKTRLDEAHRIMGIANTQSVQMESVFNQWAKVRITDKEIFRLIELAMAPNKETLSSLKNHRRSDLSTLFTNTCKDVYAYAMTSESQQMETTKGTVFGAYNAVTGYYQNVRKYENDDAKVKSILMGGTAQTRTQAAFNLCGQFAESGTDSLFMN